jgi:hypothetical protein
MARRPRRVGSVPRLDKRPPRYYFFLNPYSDLRFTACPQCGATTRQRKLPLVIHIDPMQLAALNKTCRYRPHCDLLIAHQNELEAWLAAYFSEHHPEIVGNDYLVVGTEDRADWLRGCAPRTPSSRHSTACTTSMRSSASRLRRDGDRGEGTALEAIPVGR